MPEKIFIHNLKNDLLVLKYLVSKISNEDAIKEKIFSTIELASSRCNDILHPHNDKDQFLILNKEIDEVTAFFPDFKFEKDLAVVLSIVANKRCFQDFIANIIINSKEAGADTVKFEIINKSLIISDDGNCSQEITERINSGEVFTTKQNGSGIGNQSIRNFAEKYNCKVLYSTCSIESSGTKKNSLVIKINFP